MARSGNGQLITRADDKIIKAIAPVRLGEMTPRLLRVVGRKRKIHLNRSER